MSTASSAVEPPCAEVVAHHLRLAGLSNARAASFRSSHVVKIDDTTEIWIHPAADDVRELGVHVSRTVGGPQRINFEGEHAWSNPLTLHNVDVLIDASPSGVIATDDERHPCWAWVHRGQQDVLIVGTDLGGDLVRFRQGDPEQARQRPTDARWGIRGERPNYLFERQIPADLRLERYADWWTISLARAVATHLGWSLASILPNDAPGALVVTGDDDQAYLEKYDQQLKVLEGLPITYFLHPLTRHTDRTLAALRSTASVDFGLHPDALDAPERYPQLFEEQRRWFEVLTSESVTSVRNHGYLNDGYWGHLPTWLSAGVRVSANIPGVDGTIVNGSLWPARVVWNGRLTRHWSILTAIGDGVRFALGMSGPESAQCVLDVARRIEGSGVPGVIVVNLHPQNVGETLHLHYALHTLVARGFVPMSLSQCLSWFERRDSADAESGSAAASRT